MELLQRICAKQKEFMKRNTMELILDTENGGTDA